LGSVIELNGIEIRFREQDRGIIREVFTENPYRIEEISEGSLVVDVGAHIGTVTLRCAVERGGKVYAYEPSGESFALLVENVQLNHLGDRVKCFNKAVGGSMQTTLKQIFEENGLERCDVLKMDCEGCEREVFIEENTPYFKRIDRIVMEWHNYDGHVYADYLRRLGFSVLLTGTGLPQLAYDPTFARGMLYARRKSP